MEVVLHCLLTDEHLLGHLAVFVALCDEADDFALALAKRAALAVTGGRMGPHHFARGGELPHHGSRGMRIEPDFSCVHLAYRFDNQLGRSLLQNNA